METITLNETQFQFNLVYSTSEDDHIELQYNHIGQLNFVADLFSELSVLNFTYIENYENSIFKSAIDNGTGAITLYLKQQTEGYDPITVVYCIDEIRLIDNKISTQYYRIKAVCSQTRLLQAQSSCYCNNLDLSLILKNIINKSKIKIKLDMESISSNTKFEFISQENESIHSQISRILTMASNGEYCYLFGYNFFLQKYSVIEISKKADKNRISTLKSIPTSKFHESNTIHSVTDAKKMEGLSASMSYDDYNNYYISQFDQKTRKWTRKKISGIDEISKSIIPNDEYEFLYKETKIQNNESFAKTDKYGIDGLYEIGDRNKFLLLNGERIEGDMIGDIGLELGNLITLTHNFVENLAGAWIISSISHSFKKEKFTTHVILSRGFRIKSELINKAKENEQF